MPKFTVDQCRDPQKLYRLLLEMQKENDQLRATVAGAKGPDLSQYATKKDITDGIAGIDNTPISVDALPGELAEPQRAKTRYGSSDPKVSDSVDGELFVNGTALKQVQNKAWVSIAGGSTTLPVVDTTAIAKGSVDPTKLVRLEVDGFTAGATRVLTPPDADIVIAGQNFANTFSASNTFSAANTVSGSMDYSNYNEYYGGAKLQNFMVTIYNNAGTLQHAISAMYSSTASFMVDKVIAASTTLTNTPQLSNVVGFTNGAGISPSVPNELVLNATASQTSGQPIFTLHPVLNTSGTDVTCMADYQNENVNGTTKWRIGIALFNVTTGAPFNITTVNIPAGKQIRINFTGCIL